MLLNDSYKMRQSSHFSQTICFCLIIHFIFSVVLFVSIIHDINVNTLTKTSVSSGQSHTSSLRSNDTIDSRFRDHSWHQKDVGASRTSGNY